MESSMTKTGIIRGRNTQYPSDKKEEKQSRYVDDSPSTYGPATHFLIAYIRDKGKIVDISVIPVEQYSSDEYVDLRDDELTSWNLTNRDERFALLEQHSMFVEKADAINMSFKTAEETEEFLIKTTRDADAANSEMQDKFGDIHYQRYNRQMYSFCEKDAKKMVSEQLTVDEYKKLSAEFEEIILKIEREKVAAAKAKEIKRQRDADFEEELEIAKTFDKSYEKLESLRQEIDNGIDKAEVALSEIEALQKKNKELELSIQRSQEDFEREIEKAQQQVQAEVDQSAEQVNAQAAELIERLKKLGEERERFSQEMDGRVDEVLERMEKRKAEIRKEMEVKKAEALAREQEEKNDSGLRKLFRRNPKNKNPTM